MDLVVILVVVLGLSAALVVGLLVGRRRSSARRRDGERTVPVAPTLRGRLAGTRTNFRSVFGTGDLDEQFWSQLEDSLIAADVGATTSAEAVGVVRGAAPADAEEARDLLVAYLEGLLSLRDRRLNLDGEPAIVLVAGVNGTGKTTTIAKLGWSLASGGRSVLLAGADTFRAAADEQLRAWASRLDLDVVSGEPGVDPAAVAYDALARAKARDVDVLIVDTAGRLHSRANLLDELAKIARVLGREGGSLNEVLLVLDGTSGQNGIAQATTFTEAVGVTGLVVTKLDGTARGGAIVAIERALDIPVKLVGVGEDPADLVAFSPSKFVEAILEP